MKKQIKKLLSAAVLLPAIMLGVGVLAIGPSVVSAQDNLTISEGATNARSDDQPENLFGDGGMFQQISNVMLFIVGAISVLMLIIGGIRYVVSGGDSTAVQNAKNTILYAIVGIVVALLAAAVVNFVIGSFEANQ
jgi:cytochrome bd-type quinol oxidase subunit 2